MEAMIEVQNLAKHFKVRQHYRGKFAALRNLTTRQYRTIKAVDQINFKIMPGELVGYLGPNGAGKSTTIKMLTGLLVPTSGEMRVNGYLPWRDRQAYVRRIGAVFGQRTTLWWDLPVIESFDLLKTIYRVPEDRFRHNLDEFRRILELDNFINTPVRSLSLGQRMRADLCAALLHDPDLLFLDEPTIGLDVVAKERIRQFIQHINADRSTTVVLTTHDLSDVQKLCKRIMVIDEGQLLYDGQLDALAQRFGGYRQLVVEMAEDYPAPQVEDAEIVQQDGVQVVYKFKQGAVTASELINRLSARYRIRDLEVREPDLEETIRRIYQERLLSPGK